MSNQPEAASTPLGTSQTKVDGLVEVNVDVPAAESFGDSGDVFDHWFWRGIVSSLCEVTNCRRALVSIASHICMRARSLKIQYRGKCMVHAVPLPDINTPERKKLSNETFGTGPNFLLRINVATEASRVKARALTMERFKCVMRPELVLAMFSAKRFPATTESNGFGSIITSLMKVEALVKSKGDAKSADSIATINHELKTDMLTAPWADLMFPIGATARMPEVIEACNSKAAIAGCISTKEVYPVDEEMFPYCSWWAGVHAMMTDAGNKSMASKVPKDRQAQFASSSFYPDFKRKALSRGIGRVNTQAFINFLNYMTPIMKLFLKTSTSVSGEELQVLESIIDSELKGGGTKIMSVHEVPMLEEPDHSLEIVGVTLPELQRSLDALFFLCCILQWQWDVRYFSKLHIARIVDSTDSSSITSEA